MLEAMEIMKPQIGCCTCAEGWVPSPQSPCSPPAGDSDLMLGRGNGSWKLEEVATGTNAGMGGADLALAPTPNADPPGLGMGRLKLAKPGSDAAPDPALCTAADRKISSPLFKGRFMSPLAGEE